MNFDLDDIINSVLGDAPVKSAAPVPGGAPKPPQPVKAAAPKPVAPAVPAAPKAAVVKPEPLPVVTAAEIQPVLTMPTFTTEDLADTMDLRRFAQLVTLNTKRWHAKVKDRKASKNAADATGAVAEAFETRKRLLVGADELLSVIHRAIDAARTKHYEMTLPWTTTGLTDEGRRTGARLLPNSLFFEYTAAMAACKREMDEAVAKFVPEYPELIKKAQIKLGNSFNIAEYPNESSIAKHFDLSFDFQPIPVGKDFDGLPKQQLESLAKHLNKSTRTMMENAMQDVWVRLREAIERMAERLSSPDKAFHHTLVGNLRDTVRLVHHLNFTKDKRVEEVRLFAETKLCAHTAEELREHPELRKRVGALAVAALNLMNKAGVK